MIRKKDIKEYIVDNGKPFVDSEIDFLKGFRMGQQFLKTDILINLESEMVKNSESWQNYSDDPDQCIAFSRRLEFLDFTYNWVRQNL